MTAMATDWTRQNPRLVVVIALTLAVLLNSCGDTEESLPAPSDFTVLAQEADGFLQARPGQPLEFPRDHGAHPGYRIEWWYLTANLEDDAGQQYGAQWTLFRYQTRLSENPSTANPWQSEQLYMAHFAVTTPDDHMAFQRYARGGKHGDIAQAGVRIEPFSAWMDDWSLSSSGETWLPLRVSATAGDTALKLDLAASGPLVLQGEDGFSKKHPNGGGSYYYSQPFIEAKGELTIDGEVVAVSGAAWIDREWSSQFLQSDQVGWDWFSVHLDSGEKLVLFRLRGHEGADDSGHYQYGALINQDGSQQALGTSQIVMEEIEFETVAGRELPLRWRIDLPEIEREFVVIALHPDQWMNLDYPYWEGVILVEGDTPGSRGRGYLEMTGY